MEKISLIITVRNEERSITLLLDAILNQTKKPDEVVITDSESTDKTPSIIASYIPTFAAHKIPLAIHSIQGNRSKGRNIAIQKAKHTIIAVTDAGCIPHPDWLQKIAGPLLHDKADVVAGFYTPTGDSPFQKAMGAYTSTMPDKLDVSTYLPSSRSIAFTKNAWKMAGMYPEHLDTSEDLQFARTLASQSLRITIVKDALVDWEQVTSLSGAFKAFYTYAKGDGKAAYFRRSVWFIYARYIVAAALMYNSSYIIVCILALLYILWSIQKNYRYVQSPEVFYILPTIQIISDIAVMIGMFVGFAERIRSHSA